MDALGRELDTLVSNLFLSNNLETGVVTPFRSPVIKAGSTLRSEGSVAGLARDLFGGESPRPDGREPDSQQCAPRASLVELLRTKCLAGEPRLLSWTYAAVMAALRSERTVMQSPPDSASADFRALLSELSGVFAGFSTRMLRDLVGLALPLAPGAAAARASATEAEDADIRQLLASAATTMPGPLSGREGDPAALEPRPALPIGLPLDISLRFAPELDSKLYARTPADLLAFRAREQLRDRTLAILRSYRDIGSSLQAPSWPEFASGLPAQVAALRAYLLPCNATWYARLLLAELELFHSHELLGGPVLTVDPAAAAASGAGSGPSSRLQQLAERLDGAPVGKGASQSASAALESAFTSARIGDFTADEHDSTETTAPPPPAPRSVQLGSGLAPAAVSAASVSAASRNQRLLAERMAGRGGTAGMASSAPLHNQALPKGAWQRGPPSQLSTRSALTPPNQDALSPHSGGKPTEPLRGATMMAAQTGGALPAYRRVVPDDGGVRGLLGPEGWTNRAQQHPQPALSSLPVAAPGSAPRNKAPRGAGLAANAHYSGGLGAGADEQALSAALIVADTLCLQGASRLFVLLVQLLDSASVSTALRLSVVSSLTCSANGAHVLSTLSEKCEQSLLLHAHRSRALAQVLAALDFSALLAVTQSAFHSDLQTTCRDLLRAPLSVDCVALLLRALRSSCLTAVVPWVCCYVGCALRCVPLSSHAALRDVMRLLLRITAEAQSALLAPERLSLRSSAEATHLIPPGTAPSAMLALVACMEELCRHPAVRASLPLSEDDATACLLTQQLKTPLTNDHGAELLECIDASAHLLGHRYLMECSSQLRTLHELLRKAAASALFRPSASLARAVSAGAHDSGHKFAFQTPSKSRPAAAVSPDLGFPSLESSVISLDSAADGSSSPLHAVRSVGYEPPGLVLPSSERQSLLPGSPAGGPHSSRKIRPILVRANLAKVDSSADSSDEVSLPGPELGASNEPQPALLTGASFQAALTASYFCAFPHLQRLNIALAEASAIEAVGDIQSAKFSASMATETSSSALLRAADGAGDVSWREADTAAAVRTATSRLQAAVGGLFGCSVEEPDASMAGGRGASCPETPETLPVSGRVSAARVHLEALQGLCAAAAEQRIRALATAARTHH